MGIWGRRNRDDRYDFGEDDWDGDDVDDVDDGDDYDDSDYSDDPDDGDGEEGDWTDDIDDGDGEDEDQYGDLLGDAYDPGQVDEDDYDRQYDRQHGEPDGGYRDADDGEDYGDPEDVDDEDWSDDGGSRRSGRDESQHRSWRAPTVALVAVAAVALIGWRLLSPEDSGSEDSVAEPSRTQQSEEVERTRSQVTPTTTTTSAAPTTTEAPKIGTGATSGKKAAESFAEAYYVDRDPKRALYYFNPNGSTSEQEMAGEISALTGSDTKTNVSEIGKNSFALQVSGVFDGTRQNYDPMTLRVGEYQGKWFVMEITAGAGV